MRITKIAACTILAILPSFAAGTSPTNYTAFVYEPESFDPNNATYYELFDAMPYATILLGDATLDDNAWNVNDFRAYVGYVLGIIQFNAQHEYITNTCLMSAYLTETVRNIDLSRVSDCVPYAGPGWYGVMATPAAISSAFVSGNTIVCYDMCNGLTFIDNAFPGHGVGLGWGSTVASDYSSLQVTNLWSYWGPGNITLSDALWSHSISIGQTSSTNSSMMTYEGTVGNDDQSGPNPGSTVPISATYDVTCSPNPFNPTTAIRVSGEPGDSYSLSIIDVRGRRIWDRKGVLSGGFTVLDWHGVDLTGRPAASGTYFAVCEIGSRFVTTKMTLAK